MLLLYIESEPSTHNSEKATEIALNNIIKAEEKNVKAGPVIMTDQSNQSNRRPVSQNDGQSVTVIKTVNSHTVIKTVN